MNSADKDSADPGDSAPVPPILDRIGLRSFLRDGSAAARRLAATVPDAVWADGVTRRPAEGTSEPGSTDTPPEEK